LTILDSFFLLINPFQYLESNKIREAGGYNFTQAAAAGQPSSFNFTGNSSLVNILQNQK